MEKKAFLEDPSLRPLLLASFLPPEPPLASILQAADKSYR